ncbi:MAG TPA: M48 family metallopeptidase [Woeseiaceae bacterium]|nr:M48 family metallopeptidase [Woeseiaceae bacterium]
MNFFDRQDKARRVTRWLVLVFVVATALIVGCVALVAGAANVMLDAGQSGMDPAVMLSAAVFTVLFILGATAWKTAHLARGGGQVAIDMGGTLVSPDTTDPLRRRLRNVVEEMAIASGVPVPEIYVLEAESAINAFAAGFAPGDAAVAVTRGTLESLDRDELQGVIAHEFSHILNGDMRLNIRLMGVLFGIMVLGLIGRTVLRSGSRMSRISSRRSRAQPVVLLIGLALAIIGWIGVLFARMIKAAVSRQREFLADASAVQFTRQTEGIANALKKIGGYAEHSYIRAVDAEQISHMLFAGGLARLTSLLATHPPLIERIRALDPSFRESDYPTERSRQDADADSALQDSQLAAGVTAALAATGGAGVSASIGNEISNSIGDPQARHVEFAQALRRSVPADLYDAAHSRELSLLLAVALAMHPEAAVAARQARIVHEMLGEDRAVLVTRFQRQLGAIGPAYRLPLLEICFPMLKLRPLAQLEFLQQLVLRLIETDGQIELHEFCYYRILASQLGQSLAPGSRRRHASKHAMRQAAAGLVRILAEQGNTSPEDVEHAYRAGLAELGDWARDFVPEPTPGSTVAALDASLDTLAGLGARSQQRLVAAISRCIAHDGRLSLREAELLRAICATLNCPLPPVLAATAAGGDIRPNSV